MSAPLAFQGAWWSKMMVEGKFGLVYPYCSVFSFFCFFAIFLRKDLEERGWCVTLGAFT
ncbi:hypothetical protein CT2149 [Chlorobaculum tepidum TLS]|uniref:Uncharacterized protein n=1 Tax=Chlorobaculum tepidum (strain ATCC 49652 / DSM 12025 / NBRC 103806 / TLS) TaxID=194439 RepID=Q8KAK8_CHLTE|nr:hypothetical protein CT2149 [Chlorobaculum tepidum TLS]